MKITYKTSSHLGVKETLLLLLFSCGFGQLFGQEVFQPQSVVSDTLNKTTKISVERNAVDPALKFRPVEFYLINEKPVSKEEYIDYLRLKQL